MGKYNYYLYELIDTGFILFDFPFDMQSPFRQEFIDCFFARFEGRQIGAETPAQFRRWVKDILWENLPKFSALYKSQDIFSNPFVNVAIQKEHENASAIKTKNYGTYNSESLHRNDGLYGEYVNGVSGSYGVDYGLMEDDNRHIDKSKSTTKNKSDLNETTHITELFTDTPQTPSIKSASHSGKDVFDVPWNEGYLTTAKGTVSDHVQHVEGVVADGKTSYGGAKNNRETSNANANKSLNVDTTAGNTRQKENTKALSNTEENSAAANNASGTEMRYGLEGVTLSQAVIEWRKTFINVTKELLDEFEPCFMSVY